MLKSVPMETIIDFIKKSNNILVVSHRGPDPDAYCSSLFTYQMIKHNFPDKKIQINIEADFKNSRLEFLKGFKEIETRNAVETLKNIKPDLLIVTDMNTWNSLSRTDKDQTEETVKSLGCTVIVIDHHDRIPADFDYYCQMDRFSACDVAYTELVDNCGLKLYPGWEETMLVGIISDSNRFFFSSPVKETFKIVEKALESANTSIQEIESKFVVYTKEQMLVISELMKNLVIGDTYNYSYISWEFYEENILKNHNQSDIKTAKRIFTDDYMLRVEGKSLGFILTPRVSGTPHKSFGCSFRSVAKTYLCTKLAEPLGGGGHDTGAGFEIDAKNLEDAIAKVELHIKGHLHEAVWPSE